MERNNDDISYDYLNIASDPDIIKIINNEQLFFSDKIMKINIHFKSQERIIIITNQAIYNVKKKTLKRRIPIESILGITISDKTDEFVIHGKGKEYDYDYVSMKRKEIISLLHDLYRQKARDCFILCQCNEKLLNNYVTSKKEKKLLSNYSKMDSKSQINIDDYLNTDDRFSELDDININAKRKTIILFSRHNTIKSVQLEDFKVIKILGKGTFGKVSLVEYIPTKETYAMKSLKKNMLIQRNQIENTLLEKEILKTIDHPFLCGMMFCFQTSSRIYFVMPFLIGGELFQHLRIARVFDEDKVRFYGTQIAMGLQYLHDHKIIYRDLKPENILMDQDGYIKLADFGMSKKLGEDELAQTFCGTPEYIAPEIIKELGYDHTADWWSFGILLYEMFTGNPPYMSANRQELYEMILAKKIKFPSKSINIDAKNIILLLLDKNNQTRLGAKKGLIEIKSHPFFAALDFNLIIHKKLPAPFIPIVNDSRDYQNFDSEFTDESITQSLITKKQFNYIQKNQDKFNDFDK